MLALRKLRTHSRGGAAGGIVLPIAAFAFSLLSARGLRSQQSTMNDRAISSSSRAYLGFDVNDYPGDAALPSLKKTFSFAGYWLNNPPGASANSWRGKRENVREDGFGFLVLFNGRLDRELKKSGDPAELGAADARTAAANAQREGFHAGTAIFLDLEEGGRMLPEQHAYIFAWVDGITSAGYRAGIYCSGMPASEGHDTFVITADDIRSHAGRRQIAFFVYNDACPPSPGCVYPAHPPAPSASGVPFAKVWQFAQSPRRHEFTKHCNSTYNRDGNCYPPGAASRGAPFLDLDSASSPDPSSGRN